MLVFLPSEAAWAVPLALAGLSSSEVEDEEEEVAREWDALFRFKAGPVQLSKYLYDTAKDTQWRKIWRGIWVFDKDDTRTTNTVPNNVVHTVDLLVGGNVCWFPVFIRIPHLRMGGYRNQVCYRTTMSFQLTFNTPKKHFICTSDHLLVCTTWGGFAKKSNFVAGIKIGLLSPILDSVHVCADLLKSHLQEHKDAM